MTFKLERKSVGATLTKFHVIDGTGTTAGKHARAVNAIADALQKGRLTGPAAKQAILRGC